MLAYIFENGEFIVEIAICFIVFYVLGIDFYYFPNKFCT